MGFGREGRYKKRLIEIAQTQLIRLWEGLEIEGALDPYVQIYLMCREYGDGFTGHPCLPGPGSPLEQDAELMLAFQIFEQERKIWLDLKEKHKKEAEAWEGQIPNNII